MTTSNADNRRQYPSKSSRAVAPRSPSSVAHAFNSTALSVSSAARTSPSYPGSSDAAPVWSSAKRVDASFISLSLRLATYDVPKREKIKRDLQTVAASGRTGRNGTQTIRPIAHLDRDLKARSNRQCGYSGPSMAGGNWCAIATLGAFAKSRPTMTPPPVSDSVFASLENGAFPRGRALRPTVTPTRRAMP